jgi:SAM-dependent methyltransferase
MKIETLNACNICSGEALIIVDDKNNLCQCSTCGYTFDNPRPVLSEIMDFYSKPSQYDEWISEVDSRDILWERRIKKLRNNIQKGTLLDIGSGIGQFLHGAKNYYTQVFGTEVSESAIDIAKKRYNIDLVKGSIEEINFGNSRYDNITMFHVLEHVHNPKNVIDICFNLLNENGILTIAVPNDINCWKSNLGFVKILKNSMAGQNKVIYGKWGLSKIVLDGSLSEIHLSHFTPSVLRYLLEKCGFQVIENSLDPYFVKNSFINKISYYFYSKLNDISSTNLYDTVWMVAKK